MRFRMAATAMLLVPALSYAQDWNRQAAELAAKSGRVQAATALLVREAGTISDARLRAATLDALQRKTCVAHRIGVTAAKKKTIVEELIAQGLAKATPELMQGVFPPLQDEASSCPTLPQPFGAAPGSEFGGHHSYPGGLAIHESFNLQNSLNLFRLYQTAYGPGLLVHRDLLVAAPIWHDWAKSIVFQWRSDGSETEEATIGGTSAHHILSLAETMKRKLPPDLILTQASAHAAPVLGNEPKVVTWIRAAAIIAGVDPFAAGYLARDPAGEAHIARYLPEFSIHNLSDADFVLSIPAAKTADMLLRQLAPEFGYEPQDAAVYNTRFRNVVLSRLTAERVLMLYSESGIGAVREEILRLHLDRQPRRSGSRASDSAGPR